MASIVDAIVQGGYLEAIWESEVVWGLRMRWIGEKRDDLSMAWSAQMSMDIRDKLVVSYDKLAELRFVLSHHRVGKQLRQRHRLKDPCDGKRLSFPRLMQPR